jgi:hypothetical protein
VPSRGLYLQRPVTVAYADREEVFEAGDAFYMTPGHVPAATKGSEFLQISPAEALNETVAAIQAAMQPK